MKRIFLFSCAALISAASFAQVKTPAPSTPQKIVQTVEQLFGHLGKNIDDTKEVLRLYGNMSSATVLYVLERFMEKNLPSGDKGLMLSFGPGFSAQRILLEW